MFQHVVNFFCRRGSRIGLSYLGEFLLMSYDIMLDSNISYSHLNLPMRPEGSMLSFLHVVNFFLSQAGLSYLSEFLLVSYDIMLDSNLFYSHLNLPTRWEGSVLSFLHIVNFFL